MNHRLQLGEAAPDFTALAVGGNYGDGSEVQLAHFKEKRLVLYFYPKDDTPGCTIQACGLRDGWSALSSLPVAIFGVSVDEAVSHRHFIEKYTLPFPLLSDPQHAMVEAYGVWGEKTFQGKKSIGTIRPTFVIGRDGRIERILDKVAPAEHAALLLDSLA